MEVKNGFSYNHLYDFSRSWIRIPWSLDVSSIQTNQKAGGTEGFYRYCYFALCVVAFSWCFLFDSGFYHFDAYSLKQPCFKTDILLPSFYG